MVARVADALGFCILPPRWEVRARRKSSLDCEKFPHLANHHTLLFRIAHEVRVARAMQFYYLPSPHFPAKSVHLSSAESIPVRLPVRLQFLSRRLIPGRKSWIRVINHVKTESRCLHLRIVRVKLRRPVIDKFQEWIIQL